MTPSSLEHYTRLPQSRCRRYWFMLLRPSF